MAGCISRLPSSESHDHICTIPINSVPQALLRKDTIRASFRDIEEGLGKKMMTKSDLIRAFTRWYEQDFLERQLETIDRAANIEEHNSNPFIAAYAAKAISGGLAPFDQARALVIQRAFGTGMHTSFGTQIQKAIITIVPTASGSVIQGMDIEFQEPATGIMRYCQVKAGPYTVNKDTSEKIVDKFDKALNLAKTNGVRITNDQLIVGVLYGTQDQLSTFYKEIEKRYSVFAGKNFWQRLTGHEAFYEELITSFRTVSDQSEVDDRVEAAILKLSKQIAG